MRTRRARQEKNLGRRRANNALCHPPTTLYRFLLRNTEYISYHDLLLVIIVS